MCMHERKKQSARGGFSLIVVLIVALVGMALIGIAFYIYESTTGQAITTLERTQEYNAMQGGLERGKDLLVSLINSQHPAPRWYDKPGFTRNTEITDPDMLLIANGTISEDLTVHGDRARLQVGIYDLRFDEDMVSSSMSSNHQALMPPSVEFAIMTSAGPAAPGSGTIPPQVTNGGIYLVRAVLTIGSQEKQVETVVIQRNLEQ